MKSAFLILITLLLAPLTVLNAADAPAKPKKPAKTPQAPAIKPTVERLSYGKHPKQLMSFWKAESQKPTPLAFFIHGGGWVGGDGMRGPDANSLKELLKNGISVVSIEYRFIPEATADGETPPVRGPLYDAARALQTVRSKAAEWNIDKQRIGACGGSAGACTSLWLAFHDDLADPKSSDPISHESTRLWCAAVQVPQTSLDPQQMKEWTPNSRYGAHAFGIHGDPAKKISDFDAFLAGREKILPWIAEYSPYALVTSDDPPIYMSFTTAPALGQEMKDPTHTANFGVKLQEKCNTVGVPCELVYPDAPNVKHPTWSKYLIDKLKESRKK